MKSWIIWTIGILLGAVAGFAYWFFIGCNSGSCAITSSPVNSSLYGALLGGLLINSFKKETPKKNPPS
jgi:hypothetical protein